MSPGASKVGKSMRFPFTQVPFSDWRSSRTSVPSTTRTEQWRREISGSAMTRSPSRPITRSLEIFTSWPASGPFRDREQRNALLRRLASLLDVALGHPVLQHRGRQLLDTASSGGGLPQLLLGLRRRRGCLDLGGRLGLLALGRLERTSRLRQEHVVERGLPECEVGQGDARLVEGADDVRDSPTAVTQADGDRALLARCRD